MNWRRAILDPLVRGRWRDDPGPLDLEAVRRVLVIRNDNIGDVICTGPALDALRERFPRAHITALVCTLTAEALEGHRALDELLVYPKAKHRHHGRWESNRRLLATLATLRRQPYDLAVCFRATFSPSQAWLAYAGLARWRLGPRAEGRKASLGFFYDQPWPPPPAGLHEVERCFHLLAALGVDSSPKRLYLKVPSQAQAKAAAFLQSAGCPPRPVVVNITRWAYRADRLWSEDHYRELVALLRARGQAVAVTHAPADRDWVRGVLGSEAGNLPIFSSPSLKEFAAMIAQGRAFVTAEGGPMHVAAAVGTPQVVLWGRADQTTWRPWRASCLVVGGDGRVKDIGPDQVLAALDRLPPAEPPAEDGKP